MKCHSNGLGEYPPKKLKLGPLEKSQTLLRTSGFGRPENFLAPFNDLSGLRHYSKMGSQFPYVLHRVTLRSGKPDELMFC